MKYLNAKGEVTSVDAFTEEERVCMFATREERWREQGYRICQLSNAVKMDFGLPVPVTSLIKDTYNNTLKDMVRKRGGISVLGVVADAVDDVLAKIPDDIADLSEEIPQSTPFYRFMTTMWARVLFYHQRQYPRVSLLELVRCDLSPSCAEILRVTLLHRPDWSPKVHDEVKKCFMRLHALHTLMLSILSVPEGGAVPPSDAMQFVSLLFDRRYQTLRVDRDADVKGAE
ncbi:hypothetical protein KIPB_008527 [Kipferlia bialata]|uniref:Uncharacterized protein n=1 Tax=Kipferlia bialata TaxID=797122 RepID=A0A9K3GKW1_9EUKA|nr:hypothetical protein KIPB_008527 [Kipferlia bialata]|eukprot:g8527.t1